MSNSIVVTPFHRGLQSAARDLILRGLEEHWGSLDESLNPDLRDIADSYEAGHFVVAFFENDLVGTGGYQRISSSTVEIRRMSVERAFRRRGVASAVLAELIRHARSHGYGRIILETTATWRDAISFYEQSGFSKLGVKNGETHFELTL